MVGQKINIRIAALLLVAENWNQMQRSSVIEWKNKSWCSHIIGHYTAVPMFKLYVFLNLDCFNENIVLKNHIRIYNDFCIKIRKGQLQTIMLIRTTGKEMI